MRFGRNLLLGLLLVIAASPTAWAEEEAPRPAPPSLEAAEGPPSELPPPRMLPPAPKFGIEEMPPPPPPKFWSGGVELGANGATGNSENFKVHFGSNTKHETPDHIWLADLLYVFANSDAKRTENRALGKTRYEWLFPDSAWSWFGNLEVEYDEFKAYDVRLAAHLGVAYLFLKSDSTLVKGRVGAGASREIGGPENRFTPEALLGFDFEHKFAERHKIKASGDLFPDLHDWGEFRAEARAAYEILIDPDWNLTFRIGAYDRYDSTPEGKKRNDLEYFAVLVWKF